MIKLFFIHNPKICATLSIGSTATSFIVTTLPYLQYFGVASEIFIAWYTFYSQQKNKKNPK